MPFKQPNWQGSILSLTSSISHDTTKFSSTLDKQGVRDIGLVSPSLVGCCIFKIGIILDSFQILGTIPVERDSLKIMVIGFARTYRQTSSKFDLVRCQDR